MATLSNFSRNVDVTKLADKLHEIMSNERGVALGDSEVPASYYVSDHWAFPDCAGKILKST